MIIKVFIDNKPFEIDCDTGTQDIAWLALSACYVYGQESYPITTFLPIIARNKEGTILHPKLVLIKNRDMIGSEVYIKAKKKFGAIGSELSEEELEWSDNAFHEGRFKMTVNVFFRPAMELRKEFDIKLRIMHSISSSVALFFPDYPNEIDCVLRETGKKGELFEAQMKIPFGEIKVKKIFYCDRGSDLWDKETNDFIKNDAKFTIQPEMLSQNEKEDYLRKKEVMIRDKEIKIKEEIMQAEKDKRNEEMRLVRLREIMSQIPYTLEDIYIDIKDRLEMNEQEIVEVFNLLEQEDYLIFRQLFEMFDDLSQFFKETKAQEEGDEEEDNGESMPIDIMTMQHFLKVFLAQRPNLEELTDDFQKLYQMNLDDNIIEINFKEFVYIIIALLKNLVYKEIDVIEEIKELSETYIQKLKDRDYLSMYKDKKMVSLVKENIPIMRRVYAQYCMKIQNNVEIPPDNFLKLIEEIQVKNKIDLIKTVNERIKMSRPIDLYEFIEKLVCLGKALAEEKQQDSMEGMQGFFDIVESTLKY